MSLERELVKKFIKHKGKVIVIAVLLLISFGFYYFYYLTMFKGSIDFVKAPGEYIHTSTLPTIEPTIEVKEGRMTIETENADRDSDIIKLYAKDFGGYVENFGKSESYSEIIITLIVKIPINNFDSFFEKVKSEFKIKYSDLQIYRVSIREEVTELDILNYTMKDLERIRSEINMMPVGKDKIDLLIHLTDKELEIRNKIREISASILAKETLGKFSTVVITLVQEKPINLVPENLGREFNEKLRSMVHNSAIILIDIATGILPFILNVVRYIIYGLIIVISLIFIYIFVKKVYRKLEKKFK
jgi:hypothetical protein